jgi:tetratricopeptide (TPR) repeat protein
MLRPSPTAARRATSSLLLGSALLLLAIGGGYAGSFAPGSQRLIEARKLVYKSPTRAYELLRGMESDGLLGSGEVLMGLGNCLHAMHRDSEAAEMFARGDAMLRESPAERKTGKRDTGPYSLPDLNSWGMTLDHLGQYEEAVRIFERGLKVGPAIAELNNNLANVYRKMKRPDSAVQHYQRAVDVAPDHPLFLYNRGMGLRDLGPAHHREAIASFESAIDVKPGFFQACERNAPQPGEPAQLTKTLARSTDNKAPPLRPFWAGAEAGNLRRAVAVAEQTHGGTDTGSRAAAVGGECPRAPRAPIPLTPPRQRQASGPGKEKPLARGTGQNSKW